MKKTDIVAGNIYVNASGRGMRKVLNDTNAVLTASQKDTDCVVFEVLEGKEKGTTGTMTRQAFASWARKKIEPKHRADASHLSGIL